MLSKLPEAEGDLDSDNVDAADGIIAPVPSEADSASDDESVGEPSPDDQEGAGEEDPSVVVLSPSKTSCLCCACGSPVSVAVLGTPEALSIFDALIHLEKLNLLCRSCGNEIDPFGCNTP